MDIRKNRWLIVGLIFAIIYWLLGRVIPVGPLSMAVKGAAVAALAVHAYIRSTRITRPFAVVLALCALGDVLIEVNLIIGALAFLCGHFCACWFYGANRRRLAPSDWLIGALLLAAIPMLTNLVLPDQTGVLSYSCGLAAMTACAWCSRFRRDRVALGAMLFAVSDLLLFAQLGVLAGSAIPGMLVWPLYFGGQLLIVLGVVNRAQLMITAPSTPRANAAAWSATESGSPA